MKIGIVWAHVGVNIAGACCCGAWQKSYFAGLFAYVLLDRLMMVSMSIIGSRR